jgi:hypothetical protein
VLADRGGGVGHSLSVVGIASKDRSFEAAAKGMLAPALSFQAGGSLGGEDPAGGVDVALHLGH